jgi:hypothetical protein
MELKGCGMKLWRQASWIQRMAFGHLVASLAYFLVQVTLGLRQADFDYRTFDSGKPFAIELSEGERRNVYLTPDESAPLNFDFYPSDLNCEMRGAGGASDAGSEIYEEHRLVNGWEDFWGVESFQAPVAGRYELLCTDQAGRTYPLVLARPSSARIYGVYPGFGLILVGVTAIVFTVTMLVTRRRRGMRAHQLESSTGDQSSTP